MNIKIVIHEEETGGCWAEVPAIPGCMSQGDTMDKLLFNIREAHQVLFDGRLASIRS